MDRFLIGSNKLHVQIYFKKRITMLVIFFLSFFMTTPCRAAGVQVSGHVKSDYILIVNSYTESADWSNSFIYPIYESLISNPTNVYTEHMNMLILKSDSDVQNYKTTLFDKYSKKTPKAIVLLGNAPWVLLQEDLEKKWANIPIIICAEQDYIGPREAYIEKYAIPQNLRVPIKDYKGPLDITIVNIPAYLDETVGLMKQLVPGMNKLIFLSDSRYISAQYRENLSTLLQTKYPEIKLINFTANEIAINDLADTLRKVDSRTGILCFSWYKKNIVSGNTVLSTSDYRMFSRYTDAPVFSLTDNDIATVGMLGGYFYTNSKVAEIITNVFKNIISDKTNKNQITTIDTGSASPVINYRVLTEKQIPEDLCPKNTFFYMKQLTFWEQNKYWIMLGVAIVLILYAFLAMRFKMRMLSKIKKEQEEQLVLMNNYSSLFNNMPIAYSKQAIIRDDKGKIVDYMVTEINPFFEKYFQIKESYVGKYGSALENTTSYKDYINLYEIALSDNKTITIQQYNQTAESYFSMIIVPSQVTGYMDVFYVDNTELSQTQQMLRTLNRKLSMALEVANITPWKWDLEKGTILCDVSRSANATSEAAADEQLSVPYDLYFSKICKRDLERVKKAYDDLLAGKINKIKEEYRVFVHNGDRKTYEWVEAQAVVDKRDESGRPISLIGSSLVISDRKKLESDLIDAKDRAEESNRLKSAFLANMSHEIRTPLNAIVGFSEVLASAENEEEKHEYVSIIENNNTLLLQLISDILDLSKIEAETLEFSYSNVDLHNMLEELETTFRMRVGEDSKVEITYDGELPDCYVRTDKNRLSQVLINIINNAIKFTSEGSIQFGHRLKDEKTLYFYVQDTGCGIPEDKLDSIFGRFVKLNTFVQGTGLGLSICQTIIHNMGGEIGVESNEGYGAKFWFTLPYDSVEQNIKIVKDVVKQPVEKDKLTVLIAEDNASNFKLFETILKNEYTIYHAWDGEEAVRMFETYKPHIVLMDINMPKMDGYEATTEIRKLSKSVPIIAVTAYAYASDEQRIINSGFDGYAAKPVNSRLLKSQMLNLLKRQMIFM